MIRSAPILAMLRLCLVATVLLAGVASANVRMIEVDENALEVTLKNFSDTTTIDISAYQMCRAPGTYAAMSSLTIVGSGDLDLSPGETVTIVYAAILPAGTGIGVYLNASGFGDPANMQDYMQFKGVAGFRESVAVSAGLWSSGEFASGDPGPYFYDGDGAQNGAAFWSNTAPAVGTPALSAWGVVALALSLVALAILVPRFVREPARIRR